MLLSKCARDCTLPAETIAQMQEARAAVPALFDEAEANYEEAVGQDADAIQATYQATLDDGFRNMALFVAGCAIVGALLLIPYRGRRQQEAASAE